MNSNKSDEETKPWKTIIWMKRTYTENKNRQIIKIYIYRQICKKELYSFGWIFVLCYLRLFVGIFLQLPHLPLAPVAQQAVWLVDPTQVFMCVTDAEVGRRRYRCLRYFPSVVKQISQYFSQRNIMTGMKIKVCFRRFQVGGLRRTQTLQVGQNRARLTVRASFPEASFKATRWVYFMLMRHLKI